MAATYQAIQAWLEAQFGKFASAVKTWANGKFQPKGDFATKTELSEAIDEAKEAIVGEDLKDSLDTLESIKSWKEQHGTEYTNLVAEVQKKVDKDDVYTKTQTDEKIAEVVAGSVDLTPYLKSEDAAKTYQTIAGMSDYLTTENAASTYQPKGDYLEEGDLADYAKSADVVSNTTYNQDKATFLTSASLEGYVKDEDLTDIDEATFTAMFNEA